MQKPIAFVVNRTEAITGYAETEPLIIVAIPPPQIVKCIDAITAEQLWGGPDWSYGFKHTTATRGEWAFTVLYMWLQTFTDVKKAICEINLNISRIVALNVWSSEPVVCAKTDAPGEMQDLFPDALLEQWEAQYDKSLWE